MNAVSSDLIGKWVSSQVDAMRPNSPMGFDIEVRTHKKPRTYQQNRFLMSVLSEIIKFYQNTGFRPDNIPDWCMRSDVLKEFFKARLGVLSTGKLSTKEFGEFIDSIQRIMQEQTFGEYEPLIPEDTYTASLMKGDLR